MIDLLEIKKLLRSILISSQVALDVSQLNEDFKELEGYDIPHWEFGYVTLLDFLKSLSDVLLVIGNSKVQPVHSEKSEHVKDMVMKQRVSTKPGRFSRKRIASSEIKNQNNGKLVEANINSIFAPDFDYQLFEWEQQIMKPIHLNEIEYFPRNQEFVQSSISVIKNFNFIPDLEDTDFSNATDIDFHFDQISQKGNGNSKKENIEVGFQKSNSRFPTMALAVSNNIKTKPKKCSRRNVRSKKYINTARGSEEIRGQTREKNETSTNRIKKSSCECIPDKISQSHSMNFELRSNENIIQRSKMFEKEFNRIIRTQKVSIEPNCGQKVNGNMKNQLHNYQHLQEYHPYHDDIDGYQPFGNDSEVFNQDVKEQSTVIKLDSELIRSEVSKQNKRRKNKTKSNINYERLAYFEILPFNINLKETSTAFRNITENASRIFSRTRRRSQSQTKNNTMTKLKQNLRNGNTIRCTKNSEDGHEDSSYSNENLLREKEAKNIIANKNCVRRELEHYYDSRIVINKDFNEKIFNSITEKHQTRIQKIESETIKIKNRLEDHDTERREMNDAKDTTKRMNSSILSFGQQNISNSMKKSKNRSRLELYKGRNKINTNEIGKQSGVLENDQTDLRIVNPDGEDVNYDFQTLEMKEGQFKNKGEPSGSKNLNVIRYTPIALEKLNNEKISHVLKMNDCMEEIKSSGVSSLYLENKENRTEELSYNGRVSKRIFNFGICSTSIK